MHTLTFCMYASTWVNNSCSVRFRSKDGFIATACGDDSIRIFHEVSIHLVMHFRERLSSSVFPMWVLCLQDPSSAGSPNEPLFTLLCTVEQAHTTDVNSVSWNPKQPGVLASCSDDGTVKLWKLKTDELA